MKLFEQNFNNSLKNDSCLVNTTGWLRVLDTDFDTHTHTNTQEYMTWFSNYCALSDTSSDTSFGPRAERDSFHQLMHQFAAAAAGAAAFPAFPAAAAAELLLLRKALCHAVPEKYFMLIGSCFDILSEAVIRQPRSGIRGVVAIARGRRACEAIQTRPDTHNCRWQRQRNMEF